MGLPRGTKLPESFTKAVVQASEPVQNGYKKKKITGPITVGKALSEWHKKRMLEHASIKPVQTKDQRIRAIGPKTDFARDRVCTYMTQYAEEIFEPKRVLSEHDWLRRYREPDQRFEYYQRGNGNIKWLSPGKNKIYLFIIDDSFTQE